MKRLSDCAGNQPTSVDMKKAPVSRSQYVTYIAGLSDASPPKSFQFHPAAKVPYARPFTFTSGKGLLLV